jgi:hypothetical protein
MNAPVSAIKRCASSLEIHKLRDLGEVMTKFETKKREKK